MMCRTFIATNFVLTFALAAATGQVQAQDPTGADEVILRDIGGETYVIHKYTSAGVGGAFTPPGGVTGVEYLIVGGGGGGGWRGGDNGGGGGGGAGGLLTNVGDDLLAVSAGSSYSVVVGAGGLPVDEDNGLNGGDSSIFGLTAIGGGGGARFNNDGNSGGSGGGVAGRTNWNSGNTGGAGTLGQGHDGGDRTVTVTAGGAGGGGAGAVGADNINSLNGQAGGAGLLNTITGEDIWYAGGGGGGAAMDGTGGAGGIGGGGDGHAAGADGLGGGGGGGSYLNSGINPGAGGSGVVVVRYKADDVDVIYQNDFSTRKSLGPIGGTITHDYATGNLVGTQDSTSGTQDSWIRRNTGGSPITVVDDSGNKNVTVDSSFSHVYAMQKIGCSIDEGPLRIIVDMNSPTAWDGSYRGQYVKLGDDDFYEGISGFGSQMASGFGFDGEANDDVRFCVLDGDGAGTVDVVYGTASVNTSSWYRFVVDLDLKNNCYSLDIYDMGTTHPTLTTVITGTAVESFTNIGFRTNMGSDSADLNGITTVCLNAFDPASECQFDNLILLRIPEPGTVVLLAFGATGLLAFGRRKRK